MKILALPLYPASHPSSRFRIFALLPHLQRLGAEVVTLPAVSQETYDTCYLSSQRALRRRYHAEERTTRKLAASMFDKVDIVWLQKAPGLIPWRSWRRRLDTDPTPMVYDIDDALWMRPPAMPSGPLRLLADAHQPIAWMKQAETVTAGSRALCDFAKAHNQSSCWIPTSIDTERFQPPTGNKEGKQVVLGWMGSQATNEHLAMLFPMLARLGEKCDNVSLLAISSSDRGLPWEKLGALPYEFRIWREEREVDDLAKMDIGLLPLADDEWSRYKCGMKGLLYMASGCPVVASPIGSTRDLVIEGETGYVTDGDEEWEAALLHLINHADERRSLGDGGRKRVESHFSLATVAERLMKEVFEPLYFEDKDKSQSR
jgi:glycosyltransferase involved in cell wall biosynthesis